MIIFQWFVKYFANKHARTDVQKYICTLLAAGDDWLIPHTLDLIFLLVFFFFGLFSCWTLSSGRLPCHCSGVRTDRVRKDLLNGRNVHLSSGERLFSRGDSPGHQEDLWREAEEDRLWIQPHGFLSGGWEICVFVFICVGCKFINLFSFDTFNLFRL